MTERRFSARARGSMHKQPGLLLVLLSLGCAGAAPRPVQPLDADEVTRLRTAVLGHLTRETVNSYAHFTARPEPIAPPIKDEDWMFAKDTLLRLEERAKETDPGDERRALVN